MSDCRRGGAVLCPAGRAARHRGVDCSDHLPRFRFTHGRR
jgi:hypothetical protein